MSANFSQKALSTTAGYIDALGKIVENITNIKSVGYKKGETTFIETLNGEAQKHTTRDFSQGMLRRTGDALDIALEGNGFFEVELPDGQTGYTRAGQFKLSSEGELVTSDGYRVLPQTEQDPKVFEEAKDGTINVKVNTPKFLIPADAATEILQDGTVNTTNQQTGEKRKIGKISVVAFNNPNGLESIGKGYYLQTKTSGLAQEIKTGPDTSTKVKQGYLEYGNVDLATEFINLSQIRNILSAHFKVLKTLDKIYENVNFTISRAV